MQTKKPNTPSDIYIVNTMKYEVYIHNMSQYLQIARNKVIILQLLLS